MRKTKRIRSAAPGRRVHLTYDADTRGIVVQEGPEVSAVRFDDDSLRYISNRFLKTVRPRLKEDNAKKGKGRFADD
jgi:hypothetical protein